MIDYRNFNAKSHAEDVVAGLNLAGRNVLITGANAGIGFETAAALAGAGATVRLAGRNPERHAAAIGQIRARYPDADVHFAALDLSSLRSVQACVEALPDKPLDLLIANAGLISTKFDTTEDGFEKTIGVCHVGHASLIGQLMPRLLSAPAPRVVMLSSSAHHSPDRLDFNHLPYPREKYSAMKAYGQAKLCNLLYARELQRRYAAEGLTACAVHPGNMVTTSFGSDSVLVSLAMKLASPFTKNAGQGAATTLVAALHEPRDEVAAAYLTDCRPRRSSREATDPEVARKLWDITAGWLAEHAKN